jgi:two-component system response regulator AtoC
VGASTTRRVDVRVITATAKDLEAEVRRGTFREDLFFRLNVMPIRLPPLRERIEDIPLLSRHFIVLLSQRLKKNIEGISPAAVAMLVKHHWPGNVRELENVIERAAVLAEKRIILPENLPPELGAKTGDRRMDDIFGGFSLKTARRIMEKRLISRALESTGGNRTRAARLLEISHPSLLQKIRLYEIDL